MIPISAAKKISETYDYEQVVIVARKVDSEKGPGHEHVTTYGANTAHCQVAAMIGDKMKTFMQWPQADGLHPDTAKMLDQFYIALRARLVNAQNKYQYTNEWKTDDWELICKDELMNHVYKGNPLNVAAYAAFCWARGWSTKPE